MFSVEFLTALTTLFLGVSVASFIALIISKIFKVYLGDYRIVEGCLALTLAIILFSIRLIYCKDIDIRTPDGFMYYIILFTVGFLGGFFPKKLGITFIIFYVLYIFVFMYSIYSWFGNPNMKKEFSMESGSVFSVDGENLPVLNRNYFDDDVFIEIEVCQISRKMLLPVSEYWYRCKCVSNQNKTSCDSNIYGSRNNVDKICAKIIKVFGENKLFHQFLEIPAQEFLPSVFYIEGRTDNDEFIISASKIL